MDEYGFGKDIGAIKKELEMTLPGLIQQVKALDQALGQAMRQIEGITKTLGEHLNKEKSNVAC